MNAELLVDCKDHLGEGCDWDARGGDLWWLDVPMPSRLHRLHLAAGKHDIWLMPEMITSLAVRENGKGLIVISHYGVNFFDPATGKLERQFQHEPDKPANRGNDGAADAKGRFWFGTMQNNIAPDGSPIELKSNSGTLYRLDPDMKMTAFESGIGVSNTVCWSPDNRTMYFTDTMSGCIHAYDFDLERGVPSNKRRLFFYDKGYPDGSAVDAEGYLWNARWEGGCVVRFAPDGKVDRIVEVECPLVTSCSFGGPKLDTLYITTARYQLDGATLQKYPHSGGLFALKPGVSGRADNRFAG
jgi:sugar lactone lactonase YvrE